MIRCLALLAVALGLSGCFLPTPVSIASMGTDAVSFFFSGKTVADHGVSLALDEDCALIGALEGEICDDQPDYRDADVAVALTPLPPGRNLEQLANADPQVLASARRAAAAFGDAASGTDDLGGAFLADRSSPGETLAELGAEPGSSDLALAAGSGAPVVTVPIPTRKPVLETRAPVLLAGGFLTDAAVAPDAAAIVAYRVASAEPKEPVLTAVPIPKSRPNPVEPPLEAEFVEVEFAAVAKPLGLAPTAEGTSAHERFSRARAATEVGQAPVVRAPVVRVVARAAARDRKRVAKRYRRRVSSELGG